MRARHLSLALLPVALAAALAWAQSAPRPTRVGASSSPMWSRGFTTDGGVTSASMQSDTATVGSVDAGSVATSSLAVTGPASFGQRPTGIFFAGSVSSAGGLSVGLSGVDVATGPVPGALATDGCLIASRPGAINLGAAFTCRVSAVNTVTVNMVGTSIGLLSPSGTYRVIILGPVPAP